MSVACPRCRANYDVTLFQFGRRIRCDCGAWVDLDSGHRRVEPVRAKDALQMTEVEDGRVSHYFRKLGVAAIEITHHSLRVGDTIRIRGHTSDFSQVVKSMQFVGKPIKEAPAGCSVGVSVVEPAREHDVVYKVVD